MEELFEKMSNAELSKLYIEMIRGMLFAMDSNCDLDADARKQIYEECINVIFQLREHWKKI